MNIKVNEIQTLAIKDFGLSIESDIDLSTLDKLKKWLAHEIQLLIDHDFQRFLNMLYRIDIDEHKAKVAFADRDPPMRFAELVIERELQKITSRKKYK